MFQKTRMTKQLRGAFRCWLHLALPIPASSRFSSSHSFSSSTWAPWEADFELAQQRAREPGLSFAGSRLSARTGLGWPPPHPPGPCLPAAHRDLGLHTVHLWAPTHFLLSTRGQQPELTHRDLPQRLGHDAGNECSDPATLQMDCLWHG